MEGERESGGVVVVVVVEGREVGGEVGLAVES